MMRKMLRSAVAAAGVWVGSVSAGPAPPSSPDVELLEFLGGVDGLSLAGSQDPNAQALKKTLPAKPTEPASPAPGGQPTKSN